MKFFLAVCLLLGAGCGVLQALKENPTDRYLYKIKKDPIHLYSCGPIALQKVLGQLGHHIRLAEISHQIQKEGSALRDFLTLFERGARGITWPAEVINFLKEKGYKVTKIKRLSELSANQVAMVLVKETSQLNYHWMCFPLDSNIEGHFGKETSVRLILLIN